MNTSNIVNALIIVLAFGTLTIDSSLLAQDKSKATQAIRVEGLIRSLDEIQIPSKRDGVIERLRFRKGDAISKGDLIAEIDAVDARARLIVAQAELKAAQARAEDDSAIRSAKSRLDVSEAELSTLKQVGSSAAAIEHMRIRGEIRVNQAQLAAAIADQTHAKLDASVASAKQVVAELDVTERRIVSAIDGFVVKVNNQSGEWVTAGDPIISLVRLDQVLAEAFIRIEDIPPHRVPGLSVAFTLADSQTVFQGKIKKVSPKIDVDGRYQVWFLVTNRQAPDAEGVPQWILRPGMAGSMQLELPSKPESDLAITEFSPGN